MGRSSEERGSTKHVVGRSLISFVVAGSFVVLCDPLAGAASNWVMNLASGSSGESRSQVLPSAPTGVTASCAAPLVSQTITVTWSAVTHATSYSVYDATTGASGTYSLLASGVTTTSWTSGALTSSTNYWFKVVVTVGTKWASAKSSASAESTINSFSPFCVQP